MIQENTGTIEEHWDMNSPFYWGDQWKVDIYIYVYTHIDR